MPRDEALVEEYEAGWKLRDIRSGPPSSAPRLSGDQRRQQPQG